MSKLTRILILLGLTGLFAISQVQQSGPARPAPVFGNLGSAIGLLDELKPFTAGGHILGFRKGEMFVASGDHALKVEFVNARPVSPGEEAKSGDPESSRSGAQPLGKISYPKLWDGVTLVYENYGSGVVKSTYRIEPVGDSVSNPLNQIRLRYNVPVKVDDGGSLVFSFPTGEMRESRPVAWQEIEGSRVPVEVTYRLRGDQEVGFKAGSYDSRYQLVIDPVLSWNTFLGSSADSDHGYSIAVDTSGNVYVTGWSWATWGSPIRPHSGSADAFVAKLDGNGALLWNTFLGGSAVERGYAIVVDGSGNIYVAGESNATWGSPVRPHAGGADAFAAKLNNAGALQWNTFLGSSTDDFGYGTAVDTSGNVYVTGYSLASWGSPVRSYVGGSDVFAAKLDGNGALQWNSFLGSAADDRGWAIATYGSANIYVTGYSKATWGSPVRSFIPAQNAFMAKLDGSGALQWNTFLGGGWDIGYSLAMDTNGNAYVGGVSSATWGSPVRPFSGGGDTFVAKVNGSGVLQWNSFLGSASDDFGQGIAVDTSGNVYAAGFGTATWGSPVRPFAGSLDAFAAKLNGSGALQWNAFLGGTDYDYGYGIAVDTSGNVFVIGDSVASWGSPVRPFAGGYSDAFVAKISPVSTRKVDFNGDSHEDILWRHYGTGQNAVWYLGGYTTSGAALGYSIPQDLMALNMNHDRAPKGYRDIAEVGGNLDKPVETMFFDPQEALAFNAKQGSGDISLIQARMSASGGRQYLSPAVGPRKQTQNVLSYAYLPSVTDVQWMIVGTGDFNGDGLIDILWRNTSTGQNAVWSIYNITNIGCTYLPTMTDQNWQIVGTGDFNTDGKTDILWRNSVTGQNAVWYMNGTTYVSYAFLLGVSDMNWQIAGTGDFNNDGQTDILWRNSSTGENVVWGMNGVTYSSYAYLPAVTDANWRIMGTGDFNGDGKVDIIWRHSSSGQNAVWYMNGTTNTGYDFLLPVADSLWRIANR